MLASGFICIKQQCINMLNGYFGLMVSNNMQIGPFIKGLHIKLLTCAGRLPRLLGKYKTLGTDFLF